MKSTLSKVIFVIILEFIPTLLMIYYVFHIVYGYSKILSITTGVVMFVIFVYILKVTENLKS